MTDRELFEKSLEALEEMGGGYSQNLITALRERLAQPGQEPVAWVTGWHDGHCVIRAVDPAVILPIGTAFYTAPQPRREWVGLTRDEVLDIEETTKHPLDFARSIEAKLKEKNA